MEPKVVNSAFDIFEFRPVQSSVLETIEEPQKPVAGVDQSDVEFLVPANSETYIDPNIKLFVRGRLSRLTGRIWMRMISLA